MVGRPSTTSKSSENKENRVEIFRCFHRKRLHLRTKDLAKPSFSIVFMLVLYILRRISVDAMSYAELDFVTFKLVIELKAG